MVLHARALGLLLSLALQAAGSPPGGALLTVPQRDTLRSRTGPASAGVSGNGRFVAFTSYDRLVPADTDTRADIYVLDLQTRAITLESALEGEWLRGDSEHPRLSSDGRLLVFEMAIIASPGPLPSIQVLLRDRVLRTTTLVSRTPDGGLPNGWSSDPALSADGSTVVFVSTATDLVPGGDMNGRMSDVYRFQVAGARTERVSLDSRGVQRAEGSSFGPTISADGRWVAFTSTAPLIGVSPPAAPLPLPPGRLSGQVYVRDTAAGATYGISTAASARTSGASWNAAISADGLFVAFVSLGSDLVKGDRNGSADVFLHDRRSAITTLVSATANGRTGNGSSISPAISADGRLVAFQSEASDLLCAVRCGVPEEDTNLVFDVFMQDRATGTVRRVSADPDGGWAQESGGAALDAGGNVVAFTSRHPIDETDVGHDFDLFVSLPGAASGRGTPPPTLQVGQARTFSSLVAFSEYTLRRMASGRPSP